MTRYGRVAATALAVALAAPTLLLAQTRQRIVASTGSAKQVAVYSYIPDHCLTRGHTRVEVSEPPRLGRATVRDDVPFTIERSNYTACIGKPSTGTAVIYTGNQIGEDTMSVAVTYPDGHRETAAFQIVVAPGDPGKADVVGAAPVKGAAATGGKTDGAPR